MWRRLFRPRSIGRSPVDQWTTARSSAAGLTLDAQLGLQGLLDRWFLHRIKQALGWEGKKWLVVWNVVYFSVWFFHILGIIIPIDFHIFRGAETTNQKKLMGVWGKLGNMSIDMCKGWVIVSTTLSFPLLFPSLVVHPRIASTSCRRSRRIQSWGRQVETSKSSQVVRSRKTTSKPPTQPDLCWIIWIKLIDDRKSRSRWRCSIVPWVVWAPSQSLSRQWPMAVF